MSRIKFLVEFIPISIKCPNNILGERKNGKPRSYSAGFDYNICKECPLKEKCFRDIIKSCGWVKIKEQIL